MTSRAETIDRARAMIRELRRDKENRVFGVAVAAVLDEMLDLIAEKTSDTEGR